MFKGRSLLLATKHQKERVLAPIFQKSLGIGQVVVPDIDTDQLGTFSGETPRKGSPLDAARAKCLMAFEHSDADLALASEGSFGPHPELLLVHSNEEWLLFMDRKHQLEVFVREVSFDTNFGGTVVSNWNDLREFTIKCQFPSHALVVKDSEIHPQKIDKGITDSQQLFEIVETYFSKGENCYVETDMRAHLNPSRMKVIEQAGNALVHKILSCCPQCQTPGFGVVKALSGLPCAWCNSPTRSTLAHLYECQKCGYQVEKKHPHQKTQESPEFCNYCNP